MDIRSFFRATSNTFCTAKPIPNKKSELTREPSIKDFYSDSDSSPVKKRLKKKSKVEAQPPNLFEDDPPESPVIDKHAHNKISIRELYQLEEQQPPSARQVNLTEYFEAAPPEEPRKYKPKYFTTPKLEEDPDKKVQNVDFSSYLDSMDVKNPPLPKMPYYNEDEIKSEPHSKIQFRKFVFTGVLLNIDRDSAIDTVKKQGGFVVTGLSAQVDYLVHGEKLEDGRPFKTGVKYKKFCDINQTLENRRKRDPKTRDLIKLVDEAEFLKMIGYEKGVKHSVPKHIPTYTTYNPQPQVIHPVDPSTQLWVEKYAPTHMNDFICNQSQLNRLKDWLQSWKSTFGKSASSKSSKSKGEKTASKEAKKAFKCALVSGPPGIGKTTYVRVIAKMCNYSVLEFNASDQRNKSSIEQISIMATGGVTINCSDRTGLSHSICLIMDEVDGMSSGDRGGSQAVHRLIEKSTCPIICICNDRYAQNIRNLATKCLDLKLTPPTKQVLLNRLKHICIKEKINIDDNRLNVLCESTRCDIRQCLNTLQFTSNVTDANQDNLIDDMNRKRITMQDVNSITSPFEMTRKIFSFIEEKSINHSHVIDCFFTFYDVLPLFMNENYLKFIKDTVPPTAKWTSACSLTNSFVIADIFHTTIYNKQIFSMLPELGYFSTLVPVITLKGLTTNPGNERIDFPQTFGKLSSTNKNKRLLHEFSVSTAGKIGAQGICFSDGVPNLVYSKVLTFLKVNDVNGAVSFMISQGITRDFLTECCSALICNKDEENYDKLSTKTKSAFTRRYNTQIQTFESKNKKFIVDDDEEDEYEDDGFIVDG